jgi:hypothetical protein
MEISDKTERQSEPVDLEEVTVKIPKTLMDFLRHHTKNPQDYLSENIVIQFKALFENPNLPNHPFFDPDTLAELYKLKPILEDC